VSRSRPTHREIEERFALRAPTPLTNLTNGCLDTCNWICKRRRAGWTRKAARRRQREGGRETSFYCLPFLLLSRLVRRRDSEPRSDSSIDESMPRNLAKEKETMATHFIQEGGGPKSLVRTPPTRRSSSLIPKSQATILQWWALANKSDVFFPEKNVFPLEQVRCEPSEPPHYSTEPRHYSPSGTFDSLY